MIDRNCYRELIGGTLVNPARSLPGFDNAFWRQHPYALPPFVAALFPAIAVLLTIFLLKEVNDEYPRHVSAWHLELKLSSFRPWGGIENLIMSLRTRRHKDA